MNQNADITNFNGSATDVCKLILIGLEGVGKTTLLNEACGEHFDTSDGRAGCLIKENQKGVFFVDGFSRRYELNDMLGINYKNPGEWQKALHGRSEVHGVIFLLSASNPRDSALGELPRIYEYCSNLTIPVLFIYRDGVLRFTPFIRIYAETRETTIDDEEIGCKISKNEFVRYQNLDEVKKCIATTFQNACILHQLLDPITICGQVKVLREKNEELEMKINELNQKHEAELIKNQETIKQQSKRYDEQIEKLNRSLEEAASNNKTMQERLDHIVQKNQEALFKISNDIQSSINENQRLRISLEELMKDKQSLEDKHLKLMTDKKQLDFDFHDITRDREQIQKNKTKLEKDIAEVEQNRQTLLKEKRSLEARKEHLEHHIDETRLRLEEQLNLIVSVIHTAPGGNKRIYPKKYNTNGRWMWLPGRAYDVIEKFDEFGESTKDVICSLRKDLRKIDARYDHTSANVIEEEDSEIES
ncbi:unnamed protein product [Adineta steineri]|uniref:Uncharacterized protein n=1 Tax=Adineta steineri TaxID=433720 RepID=A0A819S9S1_9BILA|nr:unnamed protein product [Adineta steineri]CAF4066603.1 unnamed protein product [Adineta steineri]